MPVPSVTLISHHLCPYMQRIAIVLAEKGIPFERRYVELTTTPDWFLGCTQLSNTPVLLVEQQHIHETGAICDYLDSLQWSQHREWVEFATSILETTGRFYTAPDEVHLLASASELADQFAQLEAVLREGPYFAGAQFCMVDAAFGPIFRFFDVFDHIADFDLLNRTPKVRAWRRQLAQRSSVQNAVPADYMGRLWKFLLARESALARRLEAVVYSMAA